MTLDAIQPEIAELRGSIMRHFPLNPLSGRDQLIEHECEECWAVRDDFSDRRWTDVPREIIDHHFDSLPLFTPTAHRYYLPAYLLRTLDGDGQMWGTVVDFVIYDVCPDYSDWWTGRFSLFSREQLHVVATWLGFLLSHQPEFDCDDVVGWRAFDEYWKDYVG